MIWSYPTLAEFRNARMGDKIVSFSDLKKEINLIYKGNEEHLWVITKDKRQYLMKNEDLVNLPSRIKDTELIRDNQNIYHFITKASHIGFKAERHHSFRELVDAFFCVNHDNPEHHRLMRLIAIGAYIARINARICSNPEFGKDSTFEVLNYLTNSVAVFDKPRTMAKLEYGVVNSVLMVNELVPKSEEEKRIISEFLLSIGSLKPIYQKTSRGNAGYGTKDTYDITNLSLIICYNSLPDVSESDKESYFDMVFGKNVTERFIPFRFNGRLDVDQFSKSEKMTPEQDIVLMKMARSIQWWKENYQDHLKPFLFDFRGISLSGRQKSSFVKICEFIGIYADSEAEYKEMVKSLLDCHYAYLRMLNGNSLMSEFTKKEAEVEEVKENPLEWLKSQKDGECTIDAFLDKFGQDELVKLSERGDVFQPKISIVKLLE